MRISRMALKIAETLALALALFVLVGQVTAQPPAAPVEKLIQQLQDPDETTRLRAAKELGKMGAAAAPAVPALQVATKDADEDVRRVAGNSLRAIQAALASGPSEQVQRLIRDLQSPDEFVRLKAAKELGKLGSAARDAVPALQKVLQDPDEDVRLVATNSLRLIQASTGPPSAGLQKLIQQLASPDELVRMKAAKDLAKMGTAAKEAVPALTKLLQDPDEDVRRIAASAIERIQGAGPPPTTTSVAGTTWSGTENLAGFGKLTFQFDADGKAVMIDAQSRVNGNWTQTGDQVTVTFKNCVYTGTIQGQTYSGTARYTSGSDANWTFSLTRSGDLASPQQHSRQSVLLGAKPWPDFKFPPARIYPARR